MQKKIIAVAGVLLAPALALGQTSTVQIYGAMDASFETVQADGATPSLNGTPSNQYTSRGRIASNSSLLGFRGSEKLGGGLTAIFQVENQISIDGASTSANSNNSQTMANGWNLRDTYVGLRGNFGDVRIGYLNPPRRALAASYALLPGGTGDAASLNWMGRVNVGAALSPLTAAGTTGNTFGTTGTGGIGNLVSTIYRSQGVSYITPTIGGLHGHIMYTPGENADNAAPGPNTVKRDPRLWNMSLSYAQGPLSTHLSYAEINDFATQAATAAGLTAIGLNGKNETKQWLLGASYKLGSATTFALIVDNTEVGLGQVAGGDLNVERTHWTLRARHIIGPHELFAGYVLLGDNKVSGRALPAGSTYGESGGQVYKLRYGYNLSKRTQAYAIFTQIRNDKNGIYEISAISPVLGGGTGGGAGIINAGADPTLLGIGLRHTF